MMTLQNMTTPLRALLPAALMLLAATACEDTLDNPAAHTGNGPALTLVLDNNEDNAGTRTELTGSDATHHVETVDILIFQGSDDNATYVGSQTVNWLQPENTVDKQPVNHMECTLTHTFTDSKDYILLGVGKDNQFDYTYNIDEGQTLGQTYAKLQEGKDQTGIAACEFFTGTVSFTYQKEVQIDDLLMKRRVAGVMLYVTDIPTTIGDQKTARIELCLGENQKSSVLLKRDLEDKDWREPAGQSELNDSQVLATINLPEAGETDEIYQKEDGTPAIFNGGLYILPLNRATEGEDAATPTFLIKIYGEDNNTALKTFVVLNQSEEDRETFDIRSNYLYSIGTKDKPVSLGDDVILLEVLPFTGMEVGHDFGPARIQAVFAPDFDEEKYRFNCINDVFQVEVKPSLFGDKWKINIPHTTMAYDKNFQSRTYNTTPGESLEDMTHWLYILTDAQGRLSSTLTSESKAVTTYECTDDEAVNGATITFVILDYAVYRPWGWVNHTWSPQGDDIDHINNDVRWIDVTLTTTPAGADGSGTNRVDKMRITQYNTITVDFKSAQDNKDNEIATCGFSRLDWGDKFVPYPEEGYVVEQALSSDEEAHVFSPIFNDFLPNDYKSIGWGWWNTYSETLYNGSLGSKISGAANMLQIDDAMADLLGKNWDESYPGCALAKCEVLFIKIEDEKVEIADYESRRNRTTDKCWYLPAQYEMEGMWRASAISDGRLNINTTTETKTMEKVGWWTSTLGSRTDYTNGYGGLVYQSIAVPSTTFENNVIYTFKLVPLPRDAGNGNRPLPDDIDDPNEYINTSGTLMYMRPARKFTQYYKNINGEWTTLPDGQATE